MKRRVKKWSGKKTHQLKRAPCPECGKMLTGRTSRCPYCKGIKIEGERRPGDSRSQAAYEKDKAEIQAERDRRTLANELEKPASKPVEGTVNG